MFPTEETLCFIRRKQIVSSVETLCFISRKQYVSSVGNTLFQPKKHIETIQNHRKQHGMPPPHERNAHKKIPSPPERGLAAKRSVTFL